MVTTERVKELRTRFARRSDLMKYEPQEVFATVRDLAEILDEVLKRREVTASLQISN